MACAVALNYLLVHKAGVPAFFAYGPVLLIQMFINYSIVRFFVFRDQAATGPFWSHFFRFLLGSLLIRGVDWILYGILTAAGLYFLLAQALNVVIFALLRFRYVQSLFVERKPVS